MTLPHSMKLLQLEAPGRAVWRDTEVPRPAAGEVLVRILAVATCPHWDLHLFAGDPMFPGMDLRYPYLPGQPGHEATGDVVAVGPGVQRLTPGCRVAVWRDTGRRPQGCYAQYNVLREEDLLEVPVDLPLDRVASLELAMCVEVSFQTLAAQGGITGRRIGLAGLGPAGLVATQLARAHGAGEVLGIDPVASRRDLALQLGAHRAAAPDPSAWPAERDAATALDDAIDLTGVPASIEFLMDRTRRCVTLFGVLREEVRFGTRHLFGPGLALVGYADHNRAAAETALGFIKTGQLDLSALITHRLPFSRYAEAVDLLRRKEAIKVLFDPWAEA
jgi:threonine dehydrogenase-like Zn-dependent dehydrogenase